MCLDDRRSGNRYTDLRMLFYHLDANTERRWQAQGIVHTDRKMEFTLYDTHRKKMRCTLFGTHRKKMECTLYDIHRKKMECTLYDIHRKKMGCTLYGTERR